MPVYPSLLAAAETQNAGEVFGGFLIFCGIGWLIWALCKPRGYDVEVQTKGKIRPR